MEPSTREIVMKCGFSTITSDRFRPSVFNHGKKMVSHVSSVQEKRKSETESLIFGYCLPETSVRNPAYYVEFNLDAQRNVVGAYCRCQAGFSGQCKHAAALFHWINSERSDACTDNKCSWSEPSTHAKNMYPKGQPLHRIFNLEKPSKLSLATPDQSEVQKFTQLCEKFGATSSSLFKLFTAPPQPHRFQDSPATFCDPEVLSIFDHQTEQPYSYQTLVPVSANGLKFVSKRPIDSLEPPDLEAFYSASVRADREKCRAICSKTVLQGKSPDWLIERQSRITASKAHQILKARKSTTRHKYFFSSPPSDIESLKYGRELEKEAKAKYERVTSNKVLDCGLVILHSQPWLASSPDGISINSDGQKYVLEIKCPWSKRESTDLDVSYLEGGTLKKAHPYYCQVQLQLYVTNIDVAHFFVFSRKAYKLVTVNRCQDFL